jgi:hypothetical protein
MERGDQCAKTGEERRRRALALRMTLQCGPIQTCVRAVNIYTYWTDGTPLGTDHEYELFPRGLLVVRERDARVGIGRLAVVEGVAQLVQAARPGRGHLQRVRAVALRPRRFFLLNRCRRAVHTS